MKIVLWILAVLLLPLWPLHWLSCRLHAKQCPNCRSKWRTELVGEWGGEDWHCQCCGQYWYTSYTPLVEEK